MFNRSFSISRLPGFTTIAILVFVMLYLPIAMLVVFSFNSGTSVAIWEGFTLEWYPRAWANEQVKDATVRSLIIASTASVIATVVATMAALATTRRKQTRGQTFVYILINQPLMVPEIVTAVALLIFFASIKVATGYQGLGYLITAHAAFCIPFAYLPISARMQGIGPAYEEAALDLYATKRQTFTRILLPLMAPGIVSGYLLAFIVSLDDFIITNFVKGAGVETLPTAIFGAVKRGIQPNIMAISTLLLGLSILLVTLSWLVSRSDTTK